MARTETITDEQLLSAARHEFLTNGIRATTAAIAKRAGVSPGILFHRFGSKKALFSAAMASGNDQNVTTINFSLRAGEETVQQNLIDLGDKLLDKFFLIIPSQLLANVELKESADPAKHYREDGVRGQRMLAEYLRAEVELNRVRKVDPFVVAQMFGGALWGFAFEQLTGARLRAIDAHSGTHNEPTRGEFVRQLVDTIWSGMKA